MDKVVNVKASFGSGDYKIERASNGLSFFVFSIADSVEEEVLIL